MNDMNDLELARNQFNLALDRLLVAQGIHILPDLIAKCSREIESSAEIILRSRQRAPTPAPTSVTVMPDPDHLGNGLTLDETPVPFDP